MDQRNKQHYQQISKETRMALKCLNIKWIIIPINGS